MFLNGIFAHSVGFLNMKLCIFLKMHMVLSLDNFNITYNLKQHAQARLGRSAPCLGLIVYFDSNVQYRLLTCLACNTDGITDLHLTQHSMEMCEVWNSLSLKEKEKKVKCKKHLFA